MFVSNGMWKYVVWITVLLCVLMDSALATSSTTIYVDPRSSCTVQCGSSLSRAFPDIKTALASVGSSGPTPFLLLAAGEYVGPNNRDISISRSTKIRSLEGSGKTVINCQSAARGVTITKTSTWFLIEGVTIKNCISNDYGGGISITDATGTLTDVTLISNQAYYYGGGLYVSKSDQVKLISSSIIYNKAGVKGAGVYVVSSANLYSVKTVISCNTYISSSTYADLGCSGSYTDVFFGDELYTNKIGTTCDSSCSAYSVTHSVCGQSAQCIASPPPTNENPPNITTCGDAVCNLENENCLNCPTDCPQCLIDGMKYELFGGSCTPSNFSENCLKSVEIIPTPEVAYPGNASAPVPIIGRFSGYFQVPKDGEYHFLLLAKLLGAKLVINAQVYVDAFFQQPEIRSAFDVPLLTRGKVNTFELTFFSYANASLPKSIQVLWTSSSPSSAEYPSVYDVRNYVAFDDAYYTIGNATNNFIREFVRDQRINYHSRPSLISSSTCGDGICQEALPERCILDCYELLYPLCPAQATPQPISGPYQFADTLGDLIKNQYHFRFPGLEAFTHGVDIVTGEPIPTPLFSFNYCDNTSLGVAQDLYRGLMYSIPAEVFAEIDNKCSFVMSSSTYTSSAEMSSEMSASTSLAVGAKANGKIFGVSVGLEASFSQDKSVSTARSMESTKSGTIISTEVKCLTSKVQMAKHTFHPHFVRDVANAMNITAMLDVVRKYGSHYYKSAKLGGKLKQVTLIDSSSASSMSSYEMSESDKIGFAASVSGPSFGARASFDGSRDTEISQEQQSSFEQSSTRSTVLTYGGPPGAYGPAVDDAPSTFGSWAADVDTLPVPIDYELDAIGNIIPLSWTTPNGILSADLWADAEILYYQELQIPQPSSNAMRYALEWYFKAQDSHRTFDEFEDYWVNVTVYGSNDNDDVIESCSAVLMDIDGQNGTYAPAYWSSLQQTYSPRNFTFNCTRYNPVTKITLALLNPPTNPIYSEIFEITSDGFAAHNASDLLQIDFLLLYDAFNSRVYNFSIENTTAEQLSLVPRYDAHTKIVVQFSAMYASIDQAKLYPQFAATQQGSTDNLYDVVTIRIKGDRDELVRVESMKNWPWQLNTVKDFYYEIENDKNIGTVHFLSFQVATSRSLNAQDVLRSPLFIVHRIQVIQTFCPDGYSHFVSCKNDTTQGFSRVYTPRSNTSPDYASVPGTSSSLRAVLAVVQAVVNSIVATFKSFSGVLTKNQNYPLTFSLAPKKF